MAEAPKQLSPDSLAEMTQREFSAVRDEMSEGFTIVREEMAVGFGAVQRDLLESEQRLLMAVKGIEVRKEDFDVLKDEVHELARRVSALEKRR